MNIETSHEVIDRVERSIRTAWDYARNTYGSCRDKNEHVLEAKEKVEKVLCGRWILSLVS